jgi:DNA sulfur modification protein DndC
MIEMSLDITRLKVTSASPSAAPQETVRTSSEEFDVIVDSVRGEYLDETQNYPWIIGFSGGKDSTVVLQAVFEAVLGIAPKRRIRDIHVVSNNTQVESPLVVAHLRKVHALVKEAAEQLALPITVIETKPNPEQSFWVLLIGKGYPTPNQSMRWCTDRLKIQPTSRYIISNVSSHGAAIVVLGVRKSESDSRRQMIEKYRNLEDSALAPHSALPGAYVYRPIVDLTTDDVWEILGSRTPPWGSTHSDLIQLYREAEGGECPVVLSKDDAPGCGTNSSRFGCWTCTVVEKDKSLQGFVDSGNTQYQGLIAFRDWLKSIRNERQHRQAVRRNGNLTFDATGKNIPGPFTINARRLILEKLLETQSLYGEALISEEEIELIHACWAEDLMNV